jgi:hypothetical protein
VVFSLSLAPLFITTRPLDAQQRDSARAGIQRPTEPAPSSGEPTAGEPGGPPRSTGSVQVTEQPSHVRPKPPIPAGRALLYSLILPGYGQAKLDRAYAGALFFSVESVAWTMLRQAQVDLRYAEAHRHDSTLVIQTYQTDSLGQPVRDSTGKPIPATYGYSRYDSALVRARKTHVEDWIAVILFNHLISGADAFVAAQLWDLPAHVHPITGESSDHRQRYYGLALNF